MFSRRIPQQLKQTSVLEELLPHDDYEKNEIIQHSRCTDSSRLCIMLKKPPESR